MPTKATPRKNKPTAKRKVPAKKKISKKPALLSGGNPQIAKGYGNAPVKAYIAAIPGWKREIAKRIDAIVVANVPNVSKAVKWNSPFYGLEGQGWLVSYHVFERYVKVMFFSGRILVPPVPGGTSKDDSRWVDIHEGDFDDAQLTAWLKQAAALPGWGKV